MENKTHYEILGVTWTAKPEEIKKAFHDLAQKHHPDFGGLDQTVDYAAITEAYNILKDEKKRSVYNQKLKLSYIACTNCHGEGMAYKQRGFTGRLQERCLSCNGVGLRRKI